MCDSPCEYNVQVLLKTLYSNLVPDDHLQCVKRFFNSRVHYTFLRWKPTPFTTLVSVWVRERNSLSKEKMGPLKLLLETAI